jgi:hypothetical protein
MWKKMCQLQYIRGLSRIAYRLNWYQLQSTPTSVKWANLRVRDVRGAVTGIFNLGSSVTVVNVLGLAPPTVWQVSLMSFQVVTLTYVL